MKYGLWCVPEGGWVIDEFNWDAKKVVFALFDTKAAALRDLKTWCLKGLEKNYEIRPYKEAAPTDAASS